MEIVVDIGKRVRMTHEIEAGPGHQVLAVGDPGDRINDRLHAYAHLLPGISKSEQSLPLAVLTDTGVDLDGQALAGRVLECSIRTLGEPQSFDRLRRGPWIVV